MSGRRPKVPFDPDHFAIREWRDASGRLFAEEFRLSMRMPKGGGKFETWTVWRGTPPEARSPFLVVDPWAPGGWP